MDCNKLKNKKSKRHLTHLTVLRNSKVWASYTDLDSEEAAISRDEIRNLNLGVGDHRARRWSMGRRQLRRIRYMVWLR